MENIKEVLVSSEAFKPGMGFCQLHPDRCLLESACFPCWTIPWTALLQAQARPSLSDVPPQSVI